MEVKVPHYHLIFSNLYGILFSDFDPCPKPLGPIGGPFFRIPSPDHHLQTYTRDLTMTTFQDHLKLLEQPLNTCMCIK